MLTRPIDLMNGDASHSVGSGGGTAPHESAPPAPGGAEAVPAGGVESVGDGSGGGSAATVLDDTGSGVVEDIVNPALDAGALPHMLGEEDDAGSTMMMPFSPLLPQHLPLNSSLAGAGDHIVRRGTPVGMYGSGSPDLVGEHGTQLHSGLLTYNLRSSKLLTQKASMAGRGPSKAGSSPPQLGSMPKKKLTAAKTKPAFVNKLWSMVNDPVNQSLIHWSHDGKSFIVTQRERFVHEILPKYFKHSNFASFVRQLNMYGWHKVQDVKSGSIQSNSDDRWEFANENFLRGREDLLTNIIRQKSSASSRDGAALSDAAHPNAVLVANGEEVDLGILFSELETVKYNQLAIAEDLKRISKDNELLWKENMLARERHQNQQQALEKIVKFLSSLYGSNTTRLLSDHVFREPQQAVATQNYGVHSAAAMSPLHMADPLDVAPSPDPTATPVHRPRLLLKQRASPAGDWPAQVQELRTSQVPSPVLQPIPGRIQEIHPDALPADTPVLSPAVVDQASFFNDLQDNLDKQGESIQEIQDWIDKLSPASPFSRFDPRDYLAAPGFPPPQPDAADPISPRPAYKRPSNHRDETRSEDHYSPASKKQRPVSARDPPT
ncbi:AaceriAFL085Cp [[Ashbya] aceris (nom. inval.)]|nr:AaceriAFL085Cp [[Ashbya] aceris (nom. inval.)]